MVFNRAPDKFDTSIHFDIPKDRIVLLYVGRLAPEKNVKTLFQAFDLLRKEAPGRFHLFVVGDGHYRVDLIDLQKETKAVTLLRDISDQLVLAKIYRTAGLFGQPCVQG